MTQNAITLRLKRVEGQIRGLQRMIEEDTHCEQVLTQLLAARSALDQIGLLVMSNYIDNCLVSGDEEEVKDNALRIFHLILSRYSLSAEADDPAPSP